MVFLIVTIAFIRLFAINQRKTITKDHDWYQDNWDQHSMIIIPFVASVIGIITIIVMACNGAADTVTGLINPEYGAIRDIFEFVKGK